ncbi:GtrA family protein [Paenibacillus yanchengensis]|uniref:GtrA family protein n=1 Tax=Paenibacillus yanchengensis TaxID=2035833 RepID=A0ABW4YQV4_9BACL
MNRLRQFWWKNGKQFVMFNMVGLLNTFVDIAIFSLMIWFGSFIVLAQVLGYIAGMLNSYVWNSRITFRQSTHEQTPNKRESMINDRTVQKGRFIIWNGLLLLLSTVLIVVSTDYIHLGVAISKALTTVLIVVINYAGSKYWVFVDQEKRAMNERE